MKFYAHCGHTHSRYRSIRWHGGGGADLTKAWRRHHQCRQCSLLSSLLIQIPAVTAIDPSTEYRESLAKQVTN